MFAYRPYSPPVVIISIIYKYNAKYKYIIIIIIIIEINTLLRS